jgi:hypothetical protein
MTEQKPFTRTGRHRHGKIDQLQDEVYRQMFRLEARRPGSEMDLAIALLYAWTASESGPRDGQERQWLKKVCPICLQMIEAERQSNSTEQPCLQ